MKGIILSGGSGTRLYPMTSVVSKQLLPIYDKPMIYYPLSVLMLAGIKDICIISTVEDMPLYKRLLGTGEQWGMRFTYKIQEKPEGLAQAFIIAEDFIQNEPCAMILGDNIFYGSGLSNALNSAINNLNDGYSTIFGYYVDDPKRFGIMEFDDEWNILSLEEKPQSPKSNYCVTGLYFYDKNVVSLAKKVKKSERGEYEITSLNNLYLENQKLRCEILGRGFAWMDTGTTDSLLEASEFVKTIEKRQGVMISAIEEIAYRKGFISKTQLLDFSKKYSNSSYGDYLRKVANGILKY